MFLDTLEQRCDHLADKVALAFIEGESVTYGQLRETVNRSANYLLSLGIQPGDRVAAQLPKCLPFIYLHLAAAKIGAVFLPLNPAYPPPETRYFLADSGARLVFCAISHLCALESLRSDLPALQRINAIDPDARWDDRVADYAADAEYPLPTDPNQTALMLYTSGTTSRPKGAEITHGNLTANIESLQEAWGWRQDDVLLHVLPIFHVHGLVVALHGALHAGATALLCADFDAAAVLDLLRSRRFSVFMGVPTMHRRLYQIATANASTSAICA